MTANDRRTAILNAILQLLADAGLDGVTHRAVDKAAGLPQGSTTYYFPKKADLLVAAADHLATLLAKDCDELQIGFADRVAKQDIDAAIDYVGEELTIYAATARHLFLARMELTLAAARRPELTGAGERLNAAARKPIAFFLTLIAADRSADQIDTCAGLIDGITLMHVTGQGPKPTLAQVRAVFDAVL
ncbi:TetR/AcrR family transcriptional regulator [Actibacterium ureilyticum]|uniref:TetR/AcrR family transcriptional regulator n=1 Tax=Actibacterium ureilyticum TaxID=1590614 RepID=UPI000BAAB30C|nr:TetR/AcrR family transcriptional regulator [Actibacterium ureilyticum]